MAAGEARTRCCGNMGEGDPQGKRVLAKEGFTE